MRDMIDGLQCILDDEEEGDLRELMMCLAVEGKARVLRDDETVASLETEGLFLAFEKPPPLPIEIHPQPATPAAVADEALITVVVESRETAAKGGGGGAGKKVRFGVPFLLAVDAATTTDQ